MHCLWLRRAFSTLPLFLFIAAFGTNSLAQEDCTDTPGKRQSCSDDLAKVSLPLSLQQNLELSYQLTGKVELKFNLLGDPPALNQQLVRASARRDQLYEAYQAYAQAGFMAEAQQFAQQIQALDASLGMMAANQAVNDAIYYNDTRRLVQVLSNATDLGPNIQVIAQRREKPDGTFEAVYSIVDPGQPGDAPRPIDPRFTNMTSEQLRVFVSGLFAPIVPKSNEVVGIANVVDGDTLAVRGERIRLHGVDAPESEQLCAGILGDFWRCGQQAALALADRIGRRPVSCDVRDVDRYGRKVAVCEQSSEDLSRWLVSEGWAVAYRQYSTDYVSDEEGARRAGRNIWAGRFIMPWDWRRGQRLQ